MFSLSCIVGSSLLFSVGRCCNRSYRFGTGVADEKMIGLRKPRRRWWGWLVAVAYLLASMTPSLAIPLSLDELIRCEHEADRHAIVHEHDHEHDDEHSHDDAGAAVHSHDVAMAGDCDDDQDQPGHRHAACCGSVLCLSAVYPQPPSLAPFVAPRPRCEAQADVVGDEGEFRRHYRPPIA